KGRVIYTTGSSHTIGAAVSDGGWHASGSVTRTIGETVTSAWRRRDRTSWTSWEFGEYRNSRRCGSDRKAKAIAHQGGYVTTRRSRPSYRYCLPYEKGTEWKRARGTAWTYSAGVDVHGLSLNTQTGYDVDVQVQYNIRGKRQYLCGSNAPPAQAALIMGKGK
ncbi:MAG: hypothetical protein ACRCYU_19935, partial [Nocardioides sp.]